MSIQSVAIFCGSSGGYYHEYEQMAHSVGNYLASKQMKIVYGGAKIGLMGAVAAGALDAGGEVVGVIPTFLKHKEVAHDNLTEMIEVETMHERKQKMNKLCDAVITLPGGFGTMEEFFEMITWGQLGLHRKPIGVLNINGFYDPLIELCNKMNQEGFLRPENRDMVLVSPKIDELINKLNSYQPPAVGPWISIEET